MQYKGVKKKPLPQIARELGVDGIVAGTVMREGEQVRISVQLIHGPTDRNLWADSYQREVRNSLTMQGQVASAIAREVKVKLTPQEQARFASARPVNPEAHEAYLKGRYHWNKRSREGVYKSLEYFQRAIEIDPTYALAHSGMADAYSILGEGELAPREAWPKARAASLKALEIDETLGEAHASLALVEWYDDFDWAGAERDVSGSHRRA
jgi:tetratricopeptide (TPR) repeat protein